MAYLDNTSRVDGRIVLLTIPALAFFVLRGLQSMNSSDTLEELSTYVNLVVWVSPLFVLFQIFKLWDGTAARSWQNILCTLVTAAAAVMVWRTSGLQLDL